MGFIPIGPWKIVCAKAVILAHAIERDKEWVVDKFPQLCGTITTASPVRMTTGNRLYK